MQTAIEDIPGCIDPSLGTLTNGSLGKDTQSAFDDQYWSFLQPTGDGDTTTLSAEAPLFENAAGAFGVSPMSRGTPEPCPDLVLDRSPQTVLGSDTTMSEPWEPGRPGLGDSPLFSESHSQTSLQQDLKKEDNPEARVADAPGAPGKPAPKRRGRKPKKPRPSQSQIRERNRIAAGKYRTRRRSADEELEAHCQGLETDNKALATNVKELADELCDLRGKLLDHSNCNCKLIQRYIQRSASQWVENQLPGKRGL